MVFHAEKIMNDKAVLFVDDEPIMRRLLARALSPYFRVFEVQNGNEAIKMLCLHGDEIGVVITDMKMPDEDGLSLIEKMHVQFKDIPIIVCTGDLCSFDYKALITEKKIVTMLEKPITIEDTLLALKLAMALDAPNIKKPKINLK